jgi:Uma2 family endonuclease
MTLSTRLMTAEELWNLPDNQRHELVRGELRNMAPSGGEHVGVIGDLTVALGVYIKSKKLGRILGAEGGFLLSRNPDNVRAPDIAFISQKRLPSGKLPKGFISGAPDLAVEVVSPSDKAEDLEEKVQDWLGAGTKLVWVVNPRTQTVSVYENPSAAKILHIHESVDGGDILPGFKLSLREIFGMNEG